MAGVKGKSGVYIRAEKHKEICRKNLSVHKGSIPWNKGIKYSEEQKKNIHGCPKRHIPWSKLHPEYMPKGSKHWNWKGDFVKTKEYRNKIAKEYRHKKGISKKYNSELGVSYTKEYKKFQRQKRKALIKGGGELFIERIQRVYEDNIKQYGTLTCYLCLNPIPFGKDHLEHKTPLSRGGNNQYDNLAIACQRCNCKKNTKTVTEYRMEVF